MKALVTDDMAYMAREHEADCMHSLATKPAAPPHDMTLEPADETIAEVQSFVAASRQTTPGLDRVDLVVAMSDTLRGLIETPTVAEAIALAGFALRLREEHLL